jgi:UDP-2-acetamido-3-amino-2,3-dideoxy-glucuronate N-acetyltransferase
MDGSAGATPRIAAVGCGQWGRNIVRNLAELNVLSAVCDADAGVADHMSKTYGVPALALPQILEDGKYHGVAFASPAALHVKHAGDALRSGKHVFVEKPLALTVPEGRALAKLAVQTNRVLMVGHLLQYHPLILRLCEIVRAGQLGEIKHVFSSRLSRGKLRTNEDVIWSFAPHDISVILAIMGRAPVRVSAQTSAIINPDLADVANIEMDFGNAVTAHVCVSWLNPNKERKLKVIGTKAQAVLDDMLPWEDKLKVYSHNIDYSAGRPVLLDCEAMAIHVEQREPLREECVHFLDAISTGREPRTDSTEALGVLSVLEAAAHSAKTGKAVAPAPIEQD